MVLPKTNGLLKVLNVPRPSARQTPCRLWKMVMTITKRLTMQDLPNISPIPNVPNTLKGT